MTATENGATAVVVVDRLLTLAHERGASDLHLDPAEGGVEVSLRKDGALYKTETLSCELAPRLVGRFKALADLLVYQTDLPQEGRISAQRSCIGAELRIATYPTLCGERVAVRLDTAEGGPSQLGELGLPASVQEELRCAIAQPEGVLLTTGPSGSGKTTTLYSCLRHLAGGDRKVVTIEDPVERRIEGITQTEINEPAGLDFARALRSMLRQDPDVILIGEIRDRETAQISLEAGLTGHLVLSSIHAGHAALVFARLLEMGIEPFVLTTAVRGVLAQRLVRRVCPCSSQRSTSEDTRSGGCERCEHTGFDGRCIAAEWVAMSDALRSAILARCDGQAMAAAAREAGAVSLREHMNELVAEGETRMVEVQRVLGDL